MENRSIVLISNNFWTLFKFRYEIIMHLRNKGFEIHLIAEVDGYEDNFHNIDNIKCHNVNFSGRSINLINELKIYFRLKRLLKLIKPTFLFSYTIKPNIYSGLLSKSSNVVFIPMVTGLGYFFNNLKKPVRKLVHILLRSSFLSAKTVWFTNSSDKQYYIDNGIIKKSIDASIIMGAGIDFTHVPNNDKDIKNETTFLMISRLLNEKGTSEFIQAAKYFFKFNKYKFILVGAHENNHHYVKKYLVEHAVRDNVLEYYDFTDDIDQYYDRATCVVLPSYREGLSTILLEATARKIPVITADVPGCRDIIKDESYGFLCKPKSAQSLVDAMNRYIRAPDDDLLKKVNKAYEFVRDNCSRTKILEEYDKILNH